jgi:hypothetical protein
MRKPASLLVISATALLLAELLCAGGAAARVEARSDYTKTQTFSAALRYLRVDLGYDVVEKDPDAGYLLFRYAAPGRREATSGNIEVVETKGDVRVFVQLPEMPEYHERLLRDGLMKKLRDEYGAPPARGKPPAKAPAKPSGDAGAG